MPKPVAVTHADLAPSRKTTELSSKTGVLFVVFTVICGLFCFVLCLIAEATRSQEKRVDDGEDMKYQCVYSGSGKTPLLCSGVAFVGHAAVMLVEHVYMLIAVSQSPPPSAGMVSWDLDSARFKTLTWQAAFVTTWVCFAVGEILLLIGVSVESGHLNKWWKPRDGCLILGQGLFCAAGVFTLITVFLVAGLYLTALHAQKMFQHHHHVRQQVLQTSVLYASPPGSPSHRLTTMAREDPVITELSNQPSPFSFSGDFEKQFSGV